MNGNLPENNKQAIVALHSAVLLFALSGLFAKWLDISAFLLVFGRALFAAISIAIIIAAFKNQSLKCNKQTLIALAITGGILAFHWGSFFQAIKESSVAIGLITFATFPVFVSFLEPLFFKEKFSSKALIQASLTVVGISLILPENSIDSYVFIGACWGVISALAFAVLTLMNRKFVASSPAKKVAFYQNAFAAIFLIPFIAIEPVKISIEQLAILALLGIVFTALAHSLFIYSLKTIKAQAASMAVTLEPIYGIIAAYFFLGESLSIMMLIGGGIVLATNVWALQNR